MVVKLGALVGFCGSRQNIIKLIRLVLSYFAFAHLLKQRILAFSLGGQSLCVRACVCYAGVMNRIGTIVRFCLVSKPMHAPLWLLKGYI